MRDTFVFAPVYLTEGRLWISPSMSHVLMEAAEQKAEEFEKTYTDWAKVNVRQRIGKFKLV
jgi:hypothetical protein